MTVAKYYPQASFLKIKLPAHLPPSFRHPSDFSKKWCSTGRAKKLVPHPGWDKSQEACHPFRAPSANLPRKVWKS